MTEIDTTDLPDGPPSQRSLRARRLGLDTQYEAIVFMHRQCAVCRSEGFSAHARVQISHGDKTLIATLYQVTSALITHEEAALSESAWKRLGLKDGDRVVIGHPAPLDSLSHLRSRVYGHRLGAGALRAIVKDIVEGRYADIHLSAFITACSVLPLDHDEVFALTDAMVNIGERLTWPAGTVVDKHSVGGLPGNRTTPIVVAIAAAVGLTIPKTSSRAITSPAGTADTMETLAPVQLDTAAIRRVVRGRRLCRLGRISKPQSGRRHSHSRRARARHRYRRPIDCIGAVEEDRSRLYPSGHRYAGRPDREGAQQGSGAADFRRACLHRCDIRTEDTGRARRRHAANR